MSLNAELQTFYQARRLQMPADVRDTMARATLALTESGQAERAVSAGDRAPLFDLPDAAGQSVRLAEALAAGPVVLVFYRGGWCPYCNLALRALQQVHDQITARGARLIALSPQTPDDSAALADKQQLTFDLLTDPGCETAKLYGLSFDIGDELAAVYQRIGLDLDRTNAGHARTLPIPAAYVIAADGTIAWSLADADYTRRAEPADVLAALDRLGRVDAV
ncbi:MAG TPA: peroxiredoxin-like family protein [Actinocrinis sp.]|nr:peroxiredoxin-like family protein [Actinocrinis sp.]